ncbi:hypothetical protein [Escherichia coli]|uniref:hypothetical protein n=1 Tax=Escherichia coli TaxID=562 RepID=UPI000CFC200F|nr:hypothetical protein [Escherichia coli]
MIRKAYILDGKDPSPLVNRLAEVVDKIITIDRVLKNDLYTIFLKRRTKRLKSLRERLMKRAAGLVGKIENGSLGYFYVHGSMCELLVVVEIYELGEEDVGSDYEQK